eukprot:GHVU01024396.1.p2 GENE.GHVU01024396.1~~GHVU01024396.1.p2  ORF type:complete len:102 (+),score=5.68 GHVU01024396.1:549-854(+)
MVTGEDRQSGNDRLPLEVIHNPIEILRVTQISSPMKRPLVLQNARITKVSAYLVPGEELQLLKFRCQLLPHLEARSHLPVTRLNKGQAMLVCVRLHVYIST